MNQVDATTDLSALFRPSSVLLCGASRDRSRIGGKILDRLLTLAFAGRIEVLSPHDDVQGTRARDSLDGIEPVDVAVITLSAEAAAEVVEDIAEKRAAHAIVLCSAGFADAGRSDLQDRVTAACQRAGILLVGPNSVGLFGARPSFVATFATQLDRPNALPMPDGDTAVISESGAVAAFIHSGLQDAGVGVKYWAAVGNAAGVTVFDVLMWYGRQPDVRTILVYAESVDDLSGLLRSVESAVTAGKRVVFLTGGESDVGRIAAGSHSGRLTGNWQVTRAIGRRAGALLADSIEDAIDLAKVREMEPGSAGTGWVVATISGAAGIEAVDRAVTDGLHLATLSQETKERVRAVIPPFGSASNPVDITAQVVNSPHLVADATRVLLQAEEVCGVLWVLGLQEATADRIANDLVSTAATTTQLAVAWLSPPRAAMTALTEAGIPTFDSIVRMVDAVARGAGRRHRLGPGDGQGPLHVPAVPEHVAKRWLTSEGLAVPDSEPELEEGRRAIMKVSAPELLHKRKSGLMFGPVARPEERDAVASVLLRRCEDLGVRDATILTELYTAPAAKEWFFSVVRIEHQVVCFVGEGGVDVDASKTVNCVPADAADDLIERAGFRDPAGAQRLINKLLSISEQRGLSLFEVNPVGEYRDGSLICLDACAQTLEQHAGGPSNYQHGAGAPLTWRGKRRNGI